jgi:hypothetical protein
MSQPEPMVQLRGFLPVLVLPVQRQTNVNPDVQRY